MSGYSPVFSSQFIVNTQDAPNYAFEVPEGFTAVVRDVTIWTEVGAEACTVGFQNSDAAPVCWFVWLQAVGVGTSNLWQGRVVVPGGGTIVLDEGGISYTTAVYVGGYLLRNVAT